MAGVRQFYMARVEPVIHLKTTEFLGKIILQEPKSAVGEPKKDASDLALWIDGSKLELGGAGAAVVWKNPASHS